MCACFSISIESLTEYLSRPTEFSKLVGKFGGRIIWNGLELSPTYKYKSVFAFLCKNVFAFHAPGDSGFWAAGNQRIIKKINTVKLSTVLGLSPSPTQIALADLGSTWRGNSSIMKKRVNTVVFRIFFRCFKTAFSKDHTPFS